MIKESFRNIKGLYNSVDSSCISRVYLWHPTGNKKACKQTHKIIGILAKTPLNIMHGNTTLNYSKLKEWLHLWEEVNTKYAWRVWSLVNRWC